MNRGKRVVHGLVTPVFVVPVFVVPVLVVLVFVLPGAAAYRERMADTSAGAKPLNDCDGETDGYKTAEGLLE